MEGFFFFWGGVILGCEVNGTESVLSERVEKSVGKGVEKIGEVFLSVSSRRRE